MIYENIAFPEPPENRPYTFINMVATIDGKTVSGTDREPVGDLGSSTDHQVMRVLERAADGVMMGAGALRSTPGLWCPKEKYRIVVTASGNLDYQSRFFTDAPEKAIVIGPDGVEVPKPYRKLPNDFPKAFSELRRTFDIRALAIEGGSKLNGQLLAQNLIDELFLTLAPKIKLGECLPTYAGGEPLPRGSLQNYELVELHRVESEVFLRYRRIIN